MRPKNKLFYVFFTVAVQVCLTLHAGVALAVPGQTYTGDGARNNTVVPPGGWLNYGYNLDSTCFACHNGNAGPPWNAAPDMTSYLMTGHKNAMRMVQTPPLSLTGSNGLPYGADEFGDSFSWSTNTINILGFCTNSLFSTLSACTGGGGVWISGTKNLYYIYGGWMSASPGALFDGSYTQGTQKTAVSFGVCARCHTTGFTMDTTFQPGRAPDAFFLGGISWTPATPGGKINFDPDGSDGPAILSSWPIVSTLGKATGLEGVQCERCHDASTHFQAGGSVTRPVGTDATALCLQCHRQDHVLTYSGGGLGSNIAPTAFTDNFPALPANEPLFALPALEVGGPDGYEPAFYDYSIGIEFLNGAHAKFSGNFQQIADATQYSSSFTETIYSCSIPLHVSQSTCQAAGGTWSQSVVQGGCTTCHEVHQSTVQAVNAATPFKNQCIDCHTGAGTAPLVSVINHPSGPVTPLENAGTQPSSPCQICHMPPLTQGGPATHLFRINADVNYSTLPTEAQWNAGQKTAYASPDGAFTGAVWIDVEVSCGQCHGPGNAIYFTKAMLATVAPSIHTNNVGTINCTFCHTTIVQSGPGQNHHSGPCTNCHATATWPLHQGVTPPSCASCHNGTTAAGPIVQGTNHHLGSCSNCHGTDGGVPAIAGWNPTTLDTVVSGCLTCHSTVQGSFAAIVPSGVGDNHHKGHSGTDAGLVQGPGCLACHGLTGGVNTATATGKSGNQLCAVCHGAESNGQGVTHHNGTCTTCHRTDGSFSGALGAGVADNTYSGINSSDGSVTADASGNANCQMCHSSSVAKSAGGSLRSVNQGTDHHNGWCVTCHTVMGGIKAMPDPNYGITTIGGYRSIDNSIQTSCLTCHSSSQMTFNGGTLAAIVVSGTGDNHHSGDAYIPNVYGPYASDPGMYCLGCHGTVSVNDVTTHTYAITGSGLTPDTTSTEKNMQPNVHSTPGINAVSRLCVQCHTDVDTGNGSVVQENYNGDNKKNHHSGDCLICHVPDQPGGPGITTPNTPATLPTWQNCTACHSYTLGASPNGPSASHHDITHMTSCLQCHPASGVLPASSDCATCHAALDPLPANHHILAAPGTCTPCHTGGGVLPPDTTCAGCHATTQGSAAAIIGGFGPNKNHHGAVVGVTAECTECHAIGGAAASSNGISYDTQPNAFCMTCHNNTGPNYPAHHAVASETTVCTTCHAPTGGVPVTTPWADADCTICHTSPAFGTLAWNMGAINCVDCHGHQPNPATHQGTSGELVQKPVPGNVSTQTCLYCHGTSGPGKLLAQSDIDAGLVNIHGAAPTGVDFAYSFGSTSQPTNTLILNVTGTGTCVSGTCNYSWNFNNEGSATGASAQYTFAAAGNKTITLTVTDPVTLGSTSVAKTIAVQAYTPPPTASGSLTCGWTSTVTDSSTGTAIPLTDTVNWGDGGASSSITSGGSAVTHTYSKPGSYVVTLKSVDSLGQISTVALTPNPCVVSYYTISGVTYNHNGTTPAGGVSLVLRNFNTVQSCTTSPAITIQASNATTGAYSIGSLLPGRYGICASKAGYTFTNPVVDVTITNASVTRNISATTP